MYILVSESGDVRHFPEHSHMPDCPLRCLEVIDPSSSPTADVFAELTVRLSF